MVKVKVKSFSRVQRFATPWTVAHQVPPSMGFSRQKYWSGLPVPFPRESSQPRDLTLVARIAGRRFNLWATSFIKSIWKRGDCVSRWRWNAHGVLILTLVKRSANSVLCVSQPDLHFHLSFSPRAKVLKAKPQAQSENTKSQWTCRRRSKARGEFVPLPCPWNQTIWAGAGSILESGQPCQYEILKPLRFHLPGWIKIERISSNQMDRETTIIVEEDLCLNLKSPVPAGCEGQSNPQYYSQARQSPPGPELHLARASQPAASWGWIHSFQGWTYWEFKCWSGNGEIRDGIQGAAGSTAFSGAHKVQYWRDYIQILSSLARDGRGVTELGSWQRIRELEHQQAAGTFRML